MLESDVKALLAGYKPLGPKETMGRNEPCWCRSGRKWKHCHRERSRQKRPNINVPLATVRQAGAQDQIEREEAQRDLRRDDLEPRDYPDAEDATEGYGSP